MKFPYYLLFSFILVSCSAQKKNIEIVSCAKGNTGFKGRIPKEYSDRPNTGKDFYNITLKVKKLSTIEVVSLKVICDEKPMTLKAYFDDGSTKMTLGAGQTCYLRAECGNSTEQSKTVLKGSGTLTIYINGQLYTYDIKEFQSILPQ